MCNQMLPHGKFLDELKAGGYVSFMNVSYDEPNNYRPISVLPTFCKIAAAVISIRLINFLHRNNAIAEEQHGFQEGKSKQMAFISANDDIVNNVKELWI